MKEEEKINNDRFLRLGPFSVSGTKLISRANLRPDLSYQDAQDPKLFLTALQSKFGEPDVVSVTEGYSYSILDTETEVKFEAYSGSSGPAYGGSVRNFIFHANSRPELRPRVLKVFQAFEQFLLTMDAATEEE